MIIPAGYQTICLPCLKPAILINDVVIHSQTSPGVRLDRYSLFDSLDGFLKLALLPLVIKIGRLRDSTMESGRAGSDLQFGSQRDNPVWVTNVRFSQAIDRLHKTGLGY
jgi:hypothetical protein